MASPFQRDRFGFGQPTSDRPALRSMGSTPSAIANPFLQAVWGWMTGGLALTGIISWVIGNNAAMYNAVAPMIIPLFIVELGIVFYFSFRINKLSPQTATMLFLGYAALNGITLSTIFQIYALPGITSAFLVSAGTFASASVYGARTKRNLAEFRTFLYMGLVGVIIASVVNIFLASGPLYWLITYAGVIVFTGLAAWDTQRLLQMGQQLGVGGMAVRNMALMGALALYLDFINLFLMMLRIFAGNRN